MNLYAIRNKGTGKLIKFNGTTLLYQIKPPVYFSGKEIFELVTFQEEPAKSCGWCRNWGDEQYGILNNPRTGQNIPWWEWSFCPNCGKRLK